MTTTGVSGSIDLHTCSSYNISRPMDLWKVLKIWAIDFFHLPWNYWFREIVTTTGVSGVNRPTHL